MPTTSDYPKSARGAAEVEEKARRRAAMLALRDSGASKPVTLEEMLEWRHEGHRC